MILNKCVSSLHEKCIKILVEDLSYDVTIRLIFTLTSFSYNAELVFYFRKKQDFGCFTLYCLLAIAVCLFQRIPEQPCVFLTSNKKKSLKGNVTCLISCFGVDSFNVQKTNLSTIMKSFLIKNNKFSIRITSIK